jgi:hypothetical protein
MNVVELIKTKVKTYMILKMVCLEAFYGIGLNVDIINWVSILQSKSK